MKGQEIRPGQLVSSRAGRDQGHFYLVLAIRDERTALVVDGRTRPVAGPKRKNPKHLEPHACAAEDLCRRLAGGEPVDDAEIRQAIKRLASRVTGDEI
ncbi:MAG: KOW domain-containing RNA-binding protein [bacterium]|nr:KOW domain-containing RNA-binding protein [bacterium]